MERILTYKEAEIAFNKLTDIDKHRIQNDKVCFGEYFIGSDESVYFRVSPINVVMSEGRPINIRPNDLTII